MDMASWQLAIRTDENSTLQIADTIAEYRRITNLLFYNSFNRRGKSQAIVKLTPKELENAIRDPVDYRRDCAPPAEVVCLVFIRFECADGCRTCMELTSPRAQVRERPQN